MIEKGTPIVDIEKCSIRISETGPYLVFGKIPMIQQIIHVDKDGIPTAFIDALSFDMSKEPTALCRCGASRNKPYCDGAHIKASWDSALTAKVERLLDNAEITEGNDVLLTDNEKYCAFARFCDAAGRVWNLVGGTPSQEKMAIRQAKLCPAGRLKMWDKDTQSSYEFKYEPSLSIIEDPAITCSGPLWVKGGIAIFKENGEKYEQRNRVTLCRCGASSNKPFCDGSHASIKFNDEL